MLQPPIRQSFGQRFSPYPRAAAKERAPTRQTNVFERCASDAACACACVYARVCGLVCVCVLV